MYSTINVNAESNQKSSKAIWFGIAAAFIGLAAGIAFSAGQSEFYSVPATRTVQSAATYTSMRPSRVVRVEPAQLAAQDVVDHSYAVATPATQQKSHGLFYPFFLLTSSVALALSALKLASTPKVSMMTTTSVKRAWVAQSGKKYKGVQPIIAPSLLAADLANLAADSKRVMDAGADVLHVDVMDGHFVPNLSWGAPVIKCLRQHTNAFFDTHLMVSNPEDFIAPMADAGVDQFTFHIEAAKDPKALIKAIKDAGMKVGISVKPKTPIDDVFPYINDVDLILVMTVEPGFGGQSFMEDMMPKVKTLREKYPNLEIQVDGGLSPKTIDAAAKAGANAIVAGSACFVADPKGAIDAMRDSVEKYCTGPGK